MGASEVSISTARLLKGLTAMQSELCSEGALGAITAEDIGDVIETFRDVLAGGGSWKVKRDTPGDGVVTFAKGNTQFTLTDEGEIQKGNFTAEVDAYMATVIIVTLFGYEETPSYGDDSDLSIAAYLQCAMKSSRSKCEPIKREIIGLNAAAERARAEWSMKAQNAERDKIVAETDAIWGKMERFIAEAKRVEADREDIADLERVLIKHNGRRSQMVPPTPDNAKLWLDAAKYVLKDFQATEAFREIVEDEGKKVGKHYVRTDTCTRGKYEETYDCDVYADIYEFAGFQVIEE